jgi:hypothetical protein
MLESKPPEGKAGLGEQEELFDMVFANYDNDDRVQGKIRGEGRSTDGDYWR